MSKILIGTCGYGFHEWVGNVYPEGTEPRDYLACYSKLFNTLELQFTSYNMPQTAEMAQMLIDGGEKLTFSVKAYIS